MKKIAVAVDPMNKALVRIQQTLADREKAKVYQLPFWPDPTRGFPNEVIRSALFAAIQPKHRTYMDNVEISCQDGFRIIFTGQRLDQTHLDVFEGVMHIARGLHEGNYVRFSAHKLLKLIGRCDGKSDHVWLHRTMQQLTATSVQIFNKDGEKMFWGSLLPSGTADMAEGGYSVELPRHLIKLFERGFTTIDFDRRKLLRGKPLAQWLQLYYSSHAKPYPVKVEFLRNLSGSTSTLKRFKQNLQERLNELKLLAFITDWKIEDDLVYVERVPTPSQQRHLTQRPN
jgi:hypothetical protein